MIEPAPSDRSISLHAQEGGSEDRKRHLGKLHDLEDDEVARKVHGMQPLVWKGHHKR